MSSGAETGVTALASDASGVKSRVAIKEAVARTVRKRHRAERRLKGYGIAAIAFALTALVLLLVSIVSQGYTAFTQTWIRLDVEFKKELVDPEGKGTPEALREGNYGAVAAEAIEARFPQATDRRARRNLGQMVSPGADGILRRMVMATPSLVGSKQSVWVPASDDVDMLNKGYIDRKLPEDRRKIKDRQLGWYDTLVKDGAIERRVNWAFFTSSDSREPELAGIWGAVVGSALTMLVTLVLAFPLDVATAVYLEEFAPKNRWTDIIEVNINNLAAVPSIVFGLLGLAVFLGFFGLPRSAPLVGGMVLALMTLPTLIIAGRAALKAVPPSIRDAAYGLGASRVQVVTHHVLPLAMPGILTGTIIGMAQALGETAPLLMIGMVAFIVDVPGGFTDAATVLPVQIFIWADSPERAFVERTSAAIIVLLAFLIAMNAVAIYLRKKFERRW